MLVELHYLREWCGSCERKHRSGKQAMRRSHEEVWPRITDAVHWNPISLIIVFGEGNGNHSSWFFTLAWKMPWTEEPGRLSMGEPGRLLCPWGLKELDTTKWLHFLSFFHNCADTRWYIYFILKLYTICKKKKWAVYKGLYFYIYILNIKILNVKT